MMCCFKDVDDEPGQTLRRNCRPDKNRTLVISLARRSRYAAVDGIIALQQSRLCITMAKA
eukprot:scaffold5364_cov156-Skeletonema_menzelii.AAC.2